MVRSVELENFRNYKRAEVEITSDLVLILGDNASGKTNFLESLFYLARLKSFRSPDQLLPTRGENYFKLRAQTTEAELQAAVVVEPAVARSFKIDGKKVSRTAWKSFATVLFVPNDLNLFILGPAARRNFLDDTLAQIKKEYLLDLVSMGHILKQRAELLSRIYAKQAGADELAVWNEQLADVSVRICEARAGFINFLSERFAQTANSIMGFRSAFRIEYKRSAEARQEFLLHLTRVLQAEVRSGQNLVGPHREDLQIFKDGVLNIYNSSRGELRSQILALKRLQADYLTVYEHKPVVLLDDVFSELDETRRTKLLETLGPYQVFITSTEEHHLPDLKKHTQVFKISNNQILK